MKTEIDKFVIKQIKKIRKAQGYSQLDIANELGISTGFIGKIESDKYSAHYNINHLNLIAKILNCSPKDFLPQKPI